MQRISMTIAMLAMALWLAGCAMAPGVDGHSTPGGLSATWTAEMEARRLALSRTMRHSGISAVRNKDDHLQFNLPSDFAFDSESADIKAEMSDDLDQLAAALNSPAARRMRLRVVGYTDNRGPEAVNDPLSLARAHRVAQYIQSKGVDASRITVEGRGEREPMVGNDQPYGRALNRRVEIVLSEPPAAL